MNHFFQLILIFALSICCISCKKEQKKDSCSSATSIVRLVDQDSATVKFSDGNYYIFEDGTIDERLLPCSLNDSFKIDNLRVLVSGKVKETDQVP